MSGTLKPHPSKSRILMALKNAKVSILEVLRGGRSRAQENCLFLQFSVQKNQHKIFPTSKKSPNVENYH